MVNMQTNRSPLETEPLTKLLFRYSVPTNPDFDGQLHL